MMEETLFSSTPLPPFKCFARIKPFGRVRPRKGHMCIRLVRKSSTPYHREQCSVTSKAMLHTYIEHCSVTSKAVLRNIQSSAP